MIYCIFTNSPSPFGMKLLVVLLVLVHSAEPVQTAAAAEGHSGFDLPAPGSASSQTPVGSFLPGRHIAPSFPFSPCTNFQGPRKCIVLVRLLVLSVKVLCRFPS